MKKVLFGLSSSDKEALGKRARQRVVNDFSKDKMAANLDDEFRRMAGLQRASQTPWIGILGIFSIFGAVFIVLVALLLQALKV